MTGGLLAIPLISFLLAGGSVPLVGRLALRCGAVARPALDCRHREPRPYFGGLSLVGATLVTLMVVRNLPLWMAVGALALLAIGLVDDAIVLTPRQKLGANLVVALGVLASVPGFGLAPWRILDTGLALFWLLCATNSFNLIDGLDGLASGIGIVTAAAVAGTAMLHHDAALAACALALAGALTGFLVYNFYPAAIFMGDGGALPVGLLLGVLTLRAGALATNSRLTIYVFPILLMLVPLLDAAIVTVTRLATGREVSRRGLDHSHHRLLSLGLSDQRVVLLCWAVAAFSAVCAVAASAMPHPYLLSTLPLMVLAAATVGLFMMDLTFDSRSPGIAYGYLPRLARLILSVSYKWRLVDVALDGVVITAAYFGAFLIRLDFAIDNDLVSASIANLPWVILVSYPAFFAAGVYRTIWRYAGLSDVIRFAEGALLAAVLLEGFSMVRPVIASGSIVVLFAILSFNLLVASRLSFRLLRMGIRYLAVGDERVLIIGAGWLGETAARSLCHDRGRMQRLVGFVDDDLFKRGKLVDGHPVLGSLEDLEQIHNATGFNQILIAKSSLDDGRLSLAWSFANERDLDVRKFSIEVDQGQRNGMRFCTPIPGENEACG